MNIDVMYSKKTDDWKTPTDIYKSFILQGFIDTFEYKSKENQFLKKYNCKKIFINPPFSKMKEIPEYINELIKGGNTIALLIPARTDTTYFAKLCNLRPTCIYFIKGRLHYNDSKSAPFPTLLMVWKPYLNIFPLWCNITQEQLVNIRW